MNYPSTYKTPLTVESIWVLHDHDADSNDYYLVCSGRVVYVSSLDVREIAALPEGARILEPASRPEGNTADRKHDIPTPSMYDEISYIGTWWGSDVTIVLTNGSMINYDLDSNPQAIFEGRDEEFSSHPAMRFYEPADIIELEISCGRDDLEPITIKLIEDK